MSTDPWAPLESTATLPSSSGQLHVSAAGDLVFLSWLAGRASATEEATLAYRKISAALREYGAVPLQERAFGSLRVAPCVARARQAVVGSDEAWSVPPTFVEGGPPLRDGFSGVHVLAVKPDAGTAPRLITEGTARYGRIASAQGVSWIGLSDVSRRGANRRMMGAPEETGVALHAVADLLAAEGFSFHDVMRTWFYLRDILDWYGAFNATRNALFHRLGLMGERASGSLPASTGIAGRSPRGAWCTLDALAVRPHDGVAVEQKRLYNRLQNEATEYGSSFSRGVALTVGPWRYVFVSGTASIDERGASVHIGDFPAQVRRTLDTVAALLKSAGAAPQDVCQGTAFVKNARDVEPYERLLSGTAFAGRPLITTVADVCRDDLLYELDAVAVLPARRGILA
jgi:enamine deaminase RidA (YjgF/YER057c/UK114 family)